MPRSRYRACARFLIEHVENHDGIGIDTIHDAERATCIVDPQLMAPGSDYRHRSGVRQGQLVAALHQPD
jgi:hypothetical protein